MSVVNTRAGILLMIAATFVFSVQDSLSRLLAETYSPWMVVMIRYWVFAATVIILAMARPGGLGRVVRSQYPLLQVLRSLTLALEIVVAVICLKLVGLVEYHAIFVSAPLIVAALSGTILGERVGWHRWAAIAVGAIGVLVILQPGPGLMQSAALLPLLSAVLFALYALMTRYVARGDSAETSFFYSGTVGALGVTGVGLWTWQPMPLTDWGWMLGLSVSALLGHWLYIRCYAVADAGAVQPFAYFHLVFATIAGVVVFGDALSAPLVIGAGIVVTAGLLAWSREYRQS